MTKYLIGPKHNNQFIATNVGYIMTPTRHCLDDPGLVTVGLQVVHLVSEHVSKTKKGVALDDQKLFGFGVVVVPAPCDAGVRREKAELTRVGRFEHLHKDASGITVDRNAISKFLHRQITHVGGV